MNAYFDTSAIVPLLIDEPGSSTARDFWVDPTRVAAVWSVRLVYPEARAALARALRMGRITPAQRTGAIDQLDEVCLVELDYVEVDGPLVREAGELAELHGLRGYDAVHLAAAVALDDPELVVIAGDKPLLAAAREAGLAVVDIGP